MLQFRRQIGRSKVLGCRSRQPNLRVDGLDPRIIGHMTNDAQRCVPWPFPGPWVAQTTVGTSWERRRAHNVLDQGAIRRQRPEEQP